MDEILDEVLRRFVDKAPVAVMVRATLQRLLSRTTLDALFERHAEAQYTRELTFSSLVGLLGQVVFRTYGSVHAADRSRDDIPVSITAVYDKLNGLEPGITAALVREAAGAMADLIATFPATPADPDAPAGLRIRTLDGNYLAGTERRLAPLRGHGGAALPGMALVVRDDATGLLTDLIPREDAYTNERALIGAVLDLVRPDDLWLADRNFGTEGFLAGVAERRGWFLVRHHAGSTLEPLGEEVAIRHDADGSIAERAVRLGATPCRCIIVRPTGALRDGSTEVRLLTNVPEGRLDAARASALYRTRWRIEAAFQELTTALRCELDTLGYPRAALFGFGLAAVAYDVLMVIRAALSSGLGEEVAVADLSGHHLATEVAAVSSGLAVAVPESTWRKLSDWPAARFAGWLAEVARRIDWRKYRKNPRGPKKPPAVLRTRRGAHRSTARLLGRDQHPDREQGSSP